VSTHEPKHIGNRTSIFQWLLPAFWILIGGGFLMGATRITTAMVQDKHDPGPAAICILCAVALILLGILQAVQLKLTHSVSRPDDAYQAPTSQTKPESISQAVIGAVGIAFYVFAVFQIGFGLATFAFGVASMKSLGVSWRSTMLATTCCIVTVYLIFIQLLGILLPTGRWNLPF
jgi:hypothetical protein